MFLEVVPVLLVLAGMCCAMCLLYGRMLLPRSPQGTWAVLWAYGGGEGLEQRVRSLMWLHSCGFLRCAVVIADGGLNEEGRALVARLLERWPVLTLCSRQQLMERMEL